MYSRAGEMYATYLGPTAKWKINISDTLIAEIKAAIDAPLEQAPLDNTLFVKSQKEIETFLELDVWARYQEWAAGPGAIGRWTAPEDSSVKAVALDDVEKVRQ